MKESSMVNDTARIRKNSKMVAINSAIEVDVDRTSLCRFYWSANMYSGVGGQMDFIRGASLSPWRKSYYSLAINQPKMAKVELCRFLKARCRCCDN